MSDNSEIQLQVQSDNVIPLNSSILVPRPEAPSIRHFSGPVSGPMWDKVSKLGSKYPDSFDWAVYDRIHDRYGENQPRGGVVFKTTFKLVNHHSTCNKCHQAFEIDSYGRGCIHNCIYCYAKDQLTAHGFWNRPMPFPVDLSEVRKIMFTAFESNKDSKWREILERRVPLRIGSMSDSFMHMDKKYGVTKELLKILKFYEYPHIIFTRSDLVADDEYLALLDPDLVSVQMSISGNNEHLHRLIEPGAPSVKRRLDALRKLAENDIWTTVRINPMFPTHPDGFFTDKASIRERFGDPSNVPTFNMMNSEFIDQLKDARVPSLLAGFVRLSSKAINSMSQVTGIDLRAFFKPEHLAGAGDKRYSDSEIAYYYFNLKSQAAKRGIRFNTCYIGNGQKDYYQYQSLWTNKNDCCDAVGNVKAFSTTSQSVSWAERMKHAPCKESAIKSRAQELEYDKKFEPQSHRAIDKESGHIEVQP